MKSLIIFLSFVVIAGISACKKNNLTPGNTTLPGNWKVIGNWISSGGPMYFVPSTKNDHVQFNTDGSMSGTAFPDFKLYAIKDSITVKMTSADRTKYEDYYYKIKGDTLTLGMAGPMICIEGCAVELVKE